VLGSEARGTGSSHLGHLLTSSALSSSRAGELQMTARVAFRSPPASSLLAAAAARLRPLSHGFRGELDLRTERGGEDGEPPRA
jgi:hypothetical protein